MMIFLVLADPTHTNYSGVRVTGGGIQWFNKDPIPLD